jgi:hypothetical protein
MSKNSIKLEYVGNPSKHNYIFFNKAKGYYVARRSDDPEMVHIEISKYITAEDKIIKYDKRMKRIFITIKTDFGTSTLYLSNINIIKDKHKLDALEILLIYMNK